MEIFELFIKKIKKNPPLVIVISFFLVILFGTFLLSLPIASNDGKSVGVLNALFTATSATCVTGLIVVNTAAHWTVFGKVVIIALIQIGGLGTMIFLSLISIVLNKKIGLTQRMMIREQISFDTITGVVKLATYIIKFSIICELAGALFLSFRFIPDFGLKKGILFSIFHSISAFCNAGFDLIGNSIMNYRSNVLINLTIAALIIIGGLGFTVCLDVIEKKRFKNLMLHSKVAISISIVLTVVGTLGFLVLEYDSEAMEGLNLFGKTLASFFMSVSSRTAGFNSIDISKISDSSVVLTVLLMFIGASPASTGGGIKTTTFGVLLFSTISLLRGDENTEIFHKTIPIDTLLKSICIFFLASILVILSSMGLTIIEDGNFAYLDILYETVSAFGTVGVSRGITASLRGLSKLILICLMFIGRVGPATLAIALINRKSKKHTQYSHGKIIVG